MKRFDVDQFVMLTMVLATAGAVGVGVYSARGDDEAGAAEGAAGDVDVDDDAFPEAEPEPAVKTAKMVVAPVEAADSVAGVGAGVMPPLDAAPEVLDEVPGPQVESLTW